MVEFQILDADYILVNDKPVVRVFGKTESGESVCVFYEGYMPYFYAEGDLGDLKNEGGVVNIEKVRRKTVNSFDYNDVMKPEKDVYKITIKNPAQTPEFRESLRKRGVRVYEADILFKYRFMNDFGLNGLEWASVTESNGVSTSTVSVQRKIKASKIKPIKKDGDSPLKFLAFDIECVPMVRGTVPEAKKDPVIMISFVFSTQYKGNKSLVVSTKPGTGAVYVESEKELLEEFIKIVEHYDPDIITGYNVNNFDFPYILERMRKNNVKPIFGRCNQKQVVARKIGPRHKVTITGRVSVDSFEIIKKDFSLQRYGLDFVAERLLKEKKVDVKHSEIEKLWRGPQKDVDKLIEYSRMDSVLAMNLISKLNIADKYFALSKISGTLLQDTLDSGETVRIENFILREFNKQGYLFPIKPLPEEIGKRDVKRKAELLGGFVLEPEKKLHSNVVVLDFKSMYPSIIRTFNICPTTIVKSGFEHKSNIIKTSAGTYFLSSDARKGIIPKLLEQMMSKRAGVKRKFKKADKNMKRTLYANQWALKIMANAFYGLMGYSRARVYDLDIANTITACGRNIIQKTQTEIEKMGFRVVYGDTDSVFVKIPEEEMDKISKIGDEISSKITKQLPGIIELEFEKVFKRFLPMTKKRYVAWSFERSEKGWEEGIVMKGVETVRRDWCELVGDTMSEVIQIILKKDDVESSVKYFKGVIHDLMNGRIPLQKLIVTKTMTKPAKSYVGVQPHIELVKKLQSRNSGEVPGIGDRIGYVIVKGTQLLSKRTEDPAYVVENGLQIDSNYYIENQLLPPLERIFGALGISKSELLGNGKQMGILDALKMHNTGAKEKIIKELPFQETNGYICRKCSEFYPRVPLSGMCKCGGIIEFSSPKGIVERVVVN